MTCIMSNSYLCILGYILYTKMETDLFNAFFNRGQICVAILFQVSESSRVCRQLNFIFFMLVIAQLGRFISFFLKAFISFSFHRPYFILVISISTVSVIKHSVYRF